MVLCDYGKRLDTFELSMYQLLRGCLELQVRYIDCASCRCFAFQMGETPRKWFSPLIDISEAVNHLSQGLGVPIIYEKLGRGYFDLKREHIVLGPLKSNISVPEMRDYYYDGEGRYICIMKRVNQMDKEERYVVFDPHGLFGVSVGKETIISLTDNETCIIYPAERLPKSQMLTVEEIYKRGLAFREMCRSKEQDSIRKGIEHYMSVKANKITLQYAVQNLVMQLDKVCRLAVHCGFFTNTMQEQYVRYKGLLYQKAELEEVRYFPILLDAIWELFENAG